MSQADDRADPIPLRRADFAMRGSVLDILTAWGVAIDAPPDASGFVKVGTLLSDFAESIASTHRFVAGRFVPIAAWMILDSGGHDRFDSDVLGAEKVVPLGGDRFLVEGDLSAVRTRHAGLLASAPAQRRVRVVVMESTAAETILGGLGANFDASVSVDETGAPSLRFQGVADAVWSAGARSGSSALRVEFPCVEGVGTTFRRGQRIPIAERRVSESGNVTVTGFTFIDAGLTVTANLRRAGDRLRVTMSVSISSVESFVQEAPVTSESSIAGDANVLLGEVIVLAGLASERSSVVRSGIVGPFSRRNEQGESVDLTVFLWVE